MTWTLIQIQAWNNSLRIVFSRCNTWRLGDLINILGQRRSHEVKKSLGQKSSQTIKLVSEKVNGYPPKSRKVAPVEPYIIYKVTFNLKPEYKPFLSLILKTNLGANHRSAVQRPSLIWYLQCWCIRTQYINIVNLHTTDMYY